MTTPYYKRDGIAIYCGDCLEVMPGLGVRFDLCLTDPPYGIDRGGQRQETLKSSKNSRKYHKYGSWDKMPADKRHFDLIFSSSDNQIIWGGNYFTEFLPRSMGWIVWDKGQDLGMSDCELAFTSFDKALRRIVVNRANIQADGAVHPTQKPLKAILFCLNYAGNSVNSIIDPFMGSGTTLKAAQDLGNKAVGIELSEEYCKIAVDRLRQPSFFSLPNMATKKPEYEQVGF